MTITLSEDERARFDALVARDLKPYTIVAKENRFTLREVAQAIFDGERILQVRLATRPVQKTFFLAAPATGEWSVLTGHVHNFNAIADRAKITVTSTERARDIARFADTWTTTWEHGQLEIASFDEIPWRTWLEDRDEQTIEDARASVGAQIGPEQSAHGDGEHTFTTWVIAHAKLLRRTLGVTDAGRFRRSEEIVIQPLPIPLGRFWTVVDGRLIPTG